MQTLRQLRYFRPRLYLFQLRGEAKQRVFASVCGGELGADGQPETFAKKPFPRQPKPKHRFSAVFAPNYA